MYVVSNAQLYYIIMLQVFKGLTRVSYSNFIKTPQHIP